MKYSQEMILKSPSGYCMPFEERDREVEMSLGYGKQIHPKTGVEFFHHGVDWKFRCKVTPYVRSHRDPLVRLKMTPWT